MPVDPQKYVVFKREDLYQHIGFSEAIHAKLNELTLHDAVVIRKKDALAPAGLAAYANAAITVAETVERYGDIDQAKTILEIADYFASQADEARLMISRFPD